MICPTCGKEIDDTATICPNCKQALGTQIIGGATQLLTPELAEKLNTGARKEIARNDSGNSSFDSYRQDGNGYQYGSKQTSYNYQQEPRYYTSSQSNFKNHEQDFSSIVPEEYQKQNEGNIQNQYSFAGQYQNYQPDGGMQQQPFGSQYIGEDMYSSSSVPTSGGDVISMLGYVGYSILFAIPIVGLIAMLIIAATAPAGTNKKNFALAHIVLLLIGIILSILFSGFISSIIASVS